MEKRLFIVSNRLPVNIDSEDQVQLSSGGLVSAVSSYLNERDNKLADISEKIWVGVPGCSAGTWAKVADKIEATDYTYQPVFIGKKENDGYYNGLSNSTI